MSNPMNSALLRKENRQYRGTAGVSRHNRSLGYTPAFRDRDTGRCEPSRFADGSLAPVHTIAGLPGEWVVQRDTAGRAIAIKASVVAGFLRDGCFYTREQAAACRDALAVGAGSGAAAFARPPHVHPAHS